MERDDIPLMIYSIFISLLSIIIGIVFRDKELLPMIMLGISLISAIFTWLRLRRTKQSTFKILQRTCLLMALPFTFAFVPYLYVEKKGTIFTYSILILLPLFGYFVAPLRMTDNQLKAMDEKRGILNKDLENK